MSDGKGRVYTLRSRPSLIPSPPGAVEKERVGEGGEEQSRLALIWSLCLIGRP